MILAGTGHRPPKLGIGYDRGSRDLLREFVLEEFEKMKVVDGIISGMAQGFDQALAETAIFLGVPLTAALPFKGMEAKWPEDAKGVFDAILEKAERVVFTSPGEYAREKYLVRDRWIVDNSNGLIALYDVNEAHSGTGATVRHAEAAKKPVWNYWGEWEEFFRHHKKLEEWLNYGGGTDR